MYFSLALVLALFLGQLMALPLMRRGVAITLKSDTEFCSFLPPHPGNDVGATEENGIPFCTSSDLGGQTFPSGFILTSHYLEQDSYVQVTGRMDPDAYKLSHSDGGGQYDNRDIAGVTCNGYRHWVNMLEPDNGQYCIRCCQSAADCNLGQSEKGCETIVPGNYN